MMSEGYDKKVIPCDNCGVDLVNPPIINCKIFDIDGLHMFDFCSKECLIEYFGET